MRVAIAAGEKVALGTCIETLDYDGAKLAAGTDNQGNYAICHWFYSYGLGGVSVASNPNHTGYTQGGTIGVNWGETRIYNAYEWGNGGSGIFGANIQTQGTALTATQGFELSHTNLTAFVPGTIYSMSWYQPKYSASGYPANQLRRYSGGNFGTRADKVKAYSRSVGHLDRTGFELFVAATQTGSSGTVTLSGAASLVAGLSFGIAALAF
jgi:hypothetical protein